VSPSAFLSSGVRARSAAQPEASDGDADPTTWQLVRAGFVLSAQRVGENRSVTLEVHEQLEWSAATAESTRAPRQDKSPLMW
jgi:hypothetical protein